MLSYLKIVRPLNLLIIIASMFLMRYCVIMPFLQFNDLHLQLSFFDFVLLVLSVLFIAAGGYVVNDYYDMKADMVNKDCNKMVIGTKMTLKEAMRFYVILTFLGLAFGFWFSLELGDWNFFSLFLLVGGLLWFYSTTYKTIMFVGNLLVSVLVALVPLLVVIFEMVLFKENFSESIEKGEINYMPIFYFVLGFSIFAFFTNFIREIVKDVEDVEGDKKAEKKTFPIFAGFTNSKVLSFVLILIEILALYFVYFKFLNDYYSLYYITIAVVLPLLYALFLVLRAKENKDFGKVSKVLKFVMVLGLGYSFLICIQLS